MIEVLRTTHQFKIFRNNLPDCRVGFVPTMGNLHEGHLSLIEESLKNNDWTIISIFVNPKQFGPNEDFEKYPRTLGKDLYCIKDLLHEKGFEKMGKKISVFSPEKVSEIYPSDYSTTISTGKSLSGKLCGLSRPGHFDGVTTVVYQLFSLIKPNKVYFGQKDYQQYLIIKRMISDLNLDIQIIPMPIKRDTDGLALSSRNQFLSKEQKQKAIVLPEALNKIKRTIKSHTWRKAKDYVNELIADKKKNDMWDYLEVLDSTNLKTPAEDTHTVVIAGAIKVGDTRLIDNKLVELNYAR
jgi:pantoate--beta-alanine ligase